MAGLNGHIDSMFQRALEPVLRAAAQKMPVVTVLGPRQSGKTTLTRATFPSHAYVSLELPHERAQAREDPPGFLSRFGGGVILDEVQREPALLSYIQVAVDEDPRPGRFILTGSQNLLLMEKVSQTLAGRSALLSLLPLSLAELYGRSPIGPSFWEDLASSTERKSEQAPPTVSGGLWSMIWRGFYPRIHDQALDAGTWLADYYRTYVERDLRDVLRVLDLASFDRFVRLTAARTAQELNLNELAADCGITQPTARHWLTALEIGFVVTLLPPYHRNFRKRLRKRPRLHFLDTGLVCYLLGITSAEILARHPLRGFIFESYVVSELIKSFQHWGRIAPIHFWRDATGHEVDAVLDFGEQLLPVEAKSGQTPASDAMASLEWWLSLEGNPGRAGVLVHGGTSRRRVGRVNILPWWLG